MRTIHDLSENFSDGLLFPKGTSAERGNPEAGYFRYNTETKGIEVYDGTSWSSMDNTPSYVTDGLVLNLDAGNLNSYGGSGATWSDLSQEGNDGTINGATYDSNGHFTFNGSSSVVSLDSTPFKFTESFSVSTWVKVNSFAGSYNRVIDMSYYPSSNGAGWALTQYYNTSTIEFRLDDVAAAASIATNTLTLSTWYNIVGVYNSVSNLGKIYVNGLEVDSSSTSGVLDYTGVNNLRIGATTENNSSDTRFFNGDVSKVQIYNKALSSDEITQNFNASKARFGL